MQLSLESHKVDAYMTSNAVAEWQVNQDEMIAIFPKPFGTSTYGFAFAKGDPECDRWKDALDQIPEETKDRLWKKWTGADDSKKTLPKQDWPGKNGTIKVGRSGPARMTAKKRCRSRTGRERTEPSKWPLAIRSRR